MSIEGEFVRREHRRQADIIEFWRAVELFSPQQVPAVDRFDAVAPVEKVTSEQPLPWEQGHRLHGPPRRPGFERQHVVYLGVYRIDDVWQAVDDILDPGAENYDPRPAGDCALAALVVDQGGRHVGDSEVLSGLAWAAGRTRNPGPASPAWLRGFTEAQQRLVEIVDEVQRADDEYGGRAPLDHKTLGVLRARIAGLAGVAGVFEHTETRVRTVEVRSADGVDGTDFLNSFIAADLDLVAGRVATGDIGTGLARYLTEDADLDTTARVDLFTHPETSFDACQPLAVPLGRWPSNPDHPLALGQQFAINAMMGEIGYNAGVFAVNGPPGTGKSTLLRDLVAGVVVARADQLAALAHPADAFVGTPHRWQTGDYHRVVRRWTPALHGFEMVVTSSNNGAVENISNEIPACDAIDADRFSVDYFADIATALLNVDAAPDSAAEPLRAWGLAAARLGRKSYRSRFASTLWFDEKPARDEPEPATQHRRGIQSLLKQWEATGPSRPWPEAAAAYRAARDTVVELLSERQQGYEQYREHAAVRTELADVEKMLGAAAGAAQAACARESVLRVAVEREGQQRAAVAGELAAHGTGRPSWWRIFSSAGRAERQCWEARDEQLKAALALWEDSYRRAWSGHQDGQRALVDAQHDHAALAASLSGLREHISRLDAALADIRRRLGDAVPGPDWSSDPDRELKAPWSDSAVTEARSRLFLAALDLHRDFLEQVPKAMRQSLHGAMDVLTGAAPAELDAEAVADAWRALFFLVPVVSTTFASFGRVFRDMGRESLGWLLIDEAGQSTPQNPVGAIWRSRRTVVVGDPLQLEPVVTLPFRAQQAVRRTFGVSERWLPARSSAQSIADRLGRWGTTLTDGEDPIWVGAPLRVHRRCDEPMFSIVNAIAYSGTMLHGRDPEPRGSLPRSRWIDVTGPASGHFIQAEYDRLVQLLEWLDAEGHDMTEVIILSPFRQVAHRLMGLKRRFEGLTAGTVHTAQGREADVVFLVLGGDPARDGAKRWAASKPNLVNVAVSRAKKRLYVIGDQASWSRHPRFDVLMRELRAHSDAG